MFNYLIIVLWQLDFSSLKMQSNTGKLQLQQLAHKTNQSLCYTSCSSRLISISTNAT